MTGQAVYLEKMNAMKYLIIAIVSLAIFNSSCKCAREDVDLKMNLRKSGDILFITNSESFPILNSEVTINSDYILETGEWKGGEQKIVFLNDCVNSDNLKFNTYLYKVSSVSIYGKTQDGRTAWAYFTTK